VKISTATIFFIRKKLVENWRWVGRVKKMKPEIEIPIGYYRLEAGEEIKVGDLYLFNGRTWTETDLVFRTVPADTFYIRKQK
jgi:hypothetical protein